MVRQRELHGTSVRNGVEVELSHGRRRASPSQHRLSPAALVSLKFMTTTFAVRCKYCPPDAALIVTVPRIGQDVEGVLRVHLRAAHPEVEVGSGLGAVLIHFDVGESR